MPARNDTQHARNIELLHRWRGGETRALNVLLEQNSPLVWFWVRRSKWRGERDEELHAAGMIGLLRGLERYEEGHGSSVATYCTWWIRQAIDREAQRFARYRRDVSLDAMIDGDDGDGFEPAFAGNGADETGESASRRVDDETSFGQLQVRIQRLGETERVVLEAWIVHDGNLTKAAHALGVGESGARNILYRAWSKLQHPAAGGVVGDHWPERACRDVDVAEFFPNAGRTPARLRCDTCPVVHACRDYALKRPQLGGVWGGTSEHARKLLRRTAE